MGELAGAEPAWNDAGATMAAQPLSFEELFQAERDRLFRILCAITGSRQEAEDISQDEQPLPTGPEPASGGEQQGRDDREHDQWCRLRVDPTTVSSPFGSPDPSDTDAATSPPAPSSPEPSTASPPPS
jgi:hypothetical protein